MGWTLSKSLQVIPVRSIPIIQPGDRLSEKIIPSLEKTGLFEGDVVVVTHSIVSVAEESLYIIEELSISQKAISIAERNARRPELVEAALREAELIMTESPVLLTRTKHGIRTDYSGVDASNAPEGYLVALPKDPDKSARAISQSISERFGHHIPVIISDTQGRPWRRGAVNIAIGSSGMASLVDNAGAKDIHGRVLRSSKVCLADEIAAMAELVMGQADERIPVAIVRGLCYTKSKGSAADIIRSEEESIF